MWPHVLVLSCSFLYLRSRRIAPKYASLFRLAFCVPIFLRTTVYLECTIIIGRAPLDNGFFRVYYNRAGVVVAAASHWVCGLPPLAVRRSLQIATQPSEKLPTAAPKSLTAREFDSLCRHPLAEFRMWLWECSHRSSMSQPPSRETQIWLRTSVCYHVWKWLGST